MTKQETFVFEHKGIGTVIEQRRLAVPMNQREYSWGEEHVRELLQDFTNAIDEGPANYFLGTIVLTSRDDTPEVADGQQRLATTMMILAYARDFFFNIGDSDRASSIEQDFLLKRDLKTGQIAPRLRLNVDDDDFFRKVVLARPGAPDRTTPPTKRSHERILKAMETVRGHFDSLLSTRKEEHRQSVIIGWVDFLRELAQIIVLIVPSTVNAFMMFETLNDRGLRASQADLVKNFLFEHASDARINEAQQRWAEMQGALEATDVDDILMTYLRHMIICKFGPTKEREVFDRVRSIATTEQRAIDFLSDLAKGAAPYSALFSADHPLWNPLGQTAKGHVRTMIELRLEQIRPLMFAVVTKFTPEETKKALRLFVAWSVRFLVVGGGRGGLLDRTYGLQAATVMNGKITNAAELAEAMEPTVPNDAEFQAEFAVASVSQAFLARYYLRALEQYAKGETEPEWIPNSEESINLEHVMPQASEEAGWDGIPPEIAEGYYRRLGNMVLAKAKTNVAMGKQPFAEKKKLLADSGYVLTKQVSAAPAWDAHAINERQKELAVLAVKTWPITTAKPVKNRDKPSRKRA